jgi:hypothetical protein
MGAAGAEGEAKAPDCGHHFCISSHTYRLPAEFWTHTHANSFCTIYDLRTQMVGPWNAYAVNTCFLSSDRVTTLLQYNGLF